MEQAALELLLSSAPKKAGDSDLTYIPVNEKTLTMKNGDLMIVHRLLPEIAIRACNMMHEKSTHE